MKNIILLLSMLILGNLTIYASFPIETNKQKEFVITQIDDDFINPGLVLHTCHREFIVQLRSRVVIKTKDDQKVYGRITSFSNNKIHLKNRKGDENSVNLKDISQLRLRKYFLPGPSYYKHLLWLVFPAVEIWYFSSAKRLYLNNTAPVGVKDKKIALDYSIQEIPLKQLKYGKSVLCKDKYLIDVDDL